MRGVSSRGTAGLAGMLLGLTLLLVPNQASGQSVWKIGTFDQSSGEMAPGAAMLRPFVVGQSVASHDWPAFQPGSRNGSAGDKPHPRTITFTLGSKPQGSYELKIALLVEHPRISALQIDVNGHVGRFYQHPLLNYKMGDVTGAFFPEYSSDTIDAHFPASYLRRGKNQITLTAMDEASPGDAPSLDGTPAGDSGAVYDALELMQDAQTRLNVRSVEAHVRPTIFYRDVNGRNSELVDVDVTYWSRPESGTVRLSLNGTTLTLPLPADRDFGQARIEFAVPAFAQPEAATVTVAASHVRKKFTETVTPGKKWTILVVPNEHLDVGFTDYQAKVSEVHSRVIDEAMELIRTHPDFSFSLDGEWEVEQFLRGRTPEEKQKLEQMIENRKIFVPAQYASLLTGFPTAETLIRSLYPSFSLSQKLHSPFDYASITDVPSYSWSYASVLADAGLKYFIAGSDNYRGPILLLGRLHEKSPFWWQGPDGKKVLMWYSRHYHQVLTLFGMPPQVAAGHDALPVFLQIYSHPEYKAHTVLLYGAQPENTDLFPQQADLARQWNSIYSYPHLAFSGFSDAVQRIAGEMGDSIPTIRGDGGPYWEDGIASDARFAAMERQNEVRGVSAEELSTASTLVNARIAPEKQRLQSMWKNMVLMDEHTWESAVAISEPHSDEAVQQLAVKDERARRAHALAEHISRRSMASLADSISTGRDSVIVFNSLNWKRDSLVEMDLDRGWEIVDKSTGSVVPFEVVRSEKGSATSFPSVSDAYQRIRFLATDVPAVGYKVYVLRPVQASAHEEDAGRLSATTLESPYYRVELDPVHGGVKSIYDKQLGRELVNSSSPYRFGQYVYVTGADTMPNRLVQYRVVSPVPKLDPHPAGNGRLMWVKRTPFGMEARMESSDIHTPRIQTDVLVFAHEKKIEIIEHVKKQAVLNKEGVYFAFPFAMQHPEFRYEIQNGAVDPAHDMLPGAGLEWFSVQHWAEVAQDGVSAAVLPLDASMMTFGDIARGVWPTRFGQRQGTMFSYVMNNYWDTNYRAEQGGEFRFRYVVTSAASLRDSALSHMGWEEMTPFEINRVTSQDKAVNPPRPLNGKEGQFLTADNPNVLLQAWKTAEDGQGTILRLLNLSNSTQSVTVGTPLERVQSAWSCNAMEVNQHVIPVSGNGFTLELAPHQIATVRVEGDRLLKPPTI